MTGEVVEGADWPGVFGREHLRGRIGTPEELPASKVLIRPSKVSYLVAVQHGRRTASRRVSLARYRVRVRRSRSQAVTRVLITSPLSPWSHV